MLPSQGTFRIPHFLPERHKNTQLCISFQDFTQVVGRVMGWGLWSIVGAASNAVKDGMGGMERISQRLRTVSQMIKVST